MRSPALVVKGFLAGVLLCDHFANAGKSSNQPASAESSAGISGVVKFIGEIPRSPVPDDSGIRRDLVEVDRRTRGLRNVVISAIPVTPAAAQVPKARPRGQPLQMDQREYAFVPGVIAVREGEPVIFTNSDPANHNVRTASPVRSNEFNVYISEGNKHEHRFIAQDRPIRVGCDIHPWMRGWIYVFDHPNFSVTDERGEFRIGPLQPGEYMLQIEQPDIRARQQRKIKIAPAETNTVQIEMKSREPSERKE